MRNNAGENSSHQIEEFIQSKDGGGNRFLQDRRDDRPLIYKYVASDYSRGSLRQIKLKLRVEGLIEVLSIKEIMERKTAKDTKVDGSEMAGPHIAAGKAIPKDYATIDLATLLKMLIAPENEEQSISPELAAAIPVDCLG